MGKKNLYTFLAIGILFFLAGCQKVDVPTEKKTPISLTPTMHALEAYRVPDPLPQPSSGNGSVTGQFSVADPKEMMGIIVYLGDLVVADPSHYGGFLDTSRAPSTIVDSSNGKIFFKDVKPGKYCLIIYDLGEGGKAYTDSNGSVVMVQVEAGKILDLGKLEYQH